MEIFLKIEGMCIGSAPSWFCDLGCVTSSISGLVQTEQNSSGSMLIGTNAFFPTTSEPLGHCGRTISLPQEVGSQPGLHLYPCPQTYYTYYYWFSPGDSDLIDLG